MHVQKDIIIDADIKKVWKIFCRIEDWPKWGTYILAARWISKDKWKKGSRFAQTVTGFFGIKKFVSNPKVIEVVPFKKITWTGTRIVIRGVHTLKFQKIGEKTKVSNIEHFEGPLAFAMFPLIKAKFEKNLELFNEGLKNKSED